MHSIENLLTNTAQFYDIDNRDNLKSDIQFYLDYAEKQNGNILELACGTGRVSIKLAREGFNVTGLDLSDEMLDIFKQKLEVKTESLSTGSREVQISG